MKFLIAAALFALIFGGLVFVIGSTTDPKASGCAKCANPRLSALVWSPLGAVAAFLGMIAIGFVLLMWAFGPA